jgi:hypothetical protein
MIHHVSYAILFSCLSILLETFLAAAQSAAVTGRYSLTVSFCQCVN